MIYHSTWLLIPLAIVVASVPVSRGSVSDSHFTPRKLGTVRERRVTKRVVMAEPGGNLTDPF